MLAQRLTQGIPPVSTLDPLRQYVEAAWAAVPQGYIQSLFDSMPRRMSAVIANNEDIRRMDWLSRSRDLSPIEHVWDRQGRAISQRSFHPGALPPRVKSLAFGRMDFVATNIH
ncbi:hypothetical protein TNCV_1210151 [Trichonephila clavipes]|nr:hypothetical protein TNCV_1210151 [Trichonephila clavipes]